MADVMRGGDRLKEHISALSGAERLCSLVNPPAGMCGYKMREGPETTESRREERYQAEELRHRRTTAFQIGMMEVNTSFKPLKNENEHRKVIIGNLLPYIMQMSAKLLPLMKLVT